MAEANTNCRWVSFLLTLVLSACTGTSPKTSFYTLKSVSAGTEAVSGQALPLTGAIGIGPINLADPIGRTQIVTRNRQGNLEPAEFHRWSGSLADNLSAVLADEISQQLGNKAVFAYPWISGLQPIYQVRINIRQLEGELGKQALLKADWLLIGKAGGRIGNVHRTVLSEPVTGRSYADLVRAHEKNVAKLAAEIARVLRQKGTTSAEAALPLTHSDRHVKPTRKGE